MENPLSQADIDALMRALLAAGGDDLFHSKGGGVKPYDFRRPTKFKKDLLRTLAMIHDNFARLLQSFIMTNLRTRAQVLVRGTNQYSYTEYVQLLPTPTVVAAFRLDPLPGTCLMELSQNIAFAIIDRVFGGNGVDTQPQRALSEIEVGVVQRVLTDMMEPLQEAWRSMVEVQATVESLETNPVLLQATASSEVVAAITIGIQIGEHMGHLTLAFPHATVEPLLSKLSGRTWLSADQAVKGDAEQVEQSLTRAPLEVSAFLGRTRLTIAKFSQMQPGDYLLLDDKVGAEIPVYVGDRLTFMGRPGTVNGRFSVQVNRRVAVEEP